MWLVLWSVPRALRRLAASSESVSRRSRNGRRRSHSVRAVLAGSDGPPAACPCPIFSTSASPLAVSASAEDALRASRKAAPSRAARGEAPALRLLARDEEAELREKTERTVELLRFIYGCFPLTQPGVAERAARIHAAIVDLLAELQALKRALPRNDPAVARPILARLEPLIMLATSVMQRYDAERSKLNVNILGHTGIPL